MMKELKILNCGSLIATVYEDGTVRWNFEDERVRIGYGSVVEEAKNNFEKYVGTKTLIPNPLFTEIEG